MARIVRIDEQRLAKTISPELRSWIDNVIVPALVRKWLKENRSVQSEFAVESEPVEGSK